MTQMQNRICLLGAARFVRHDGRRITALPGKSWALLAYLCVNMGRKTPRRDIAALLWPKSDEQDGRASLRQELAVLRKALNGLSLGDLDAGKDYVSFSISKRLLDIKTLDVISTTDDPGILRDKIAIYKGDFLEDLQIRSAAFQTWAGIERDRYRKSVLDGLERLLTHDLAVGDRDVLTTTAKHLIKIDPTHERAHRTLMQGYIEANEPLKALHQYRVLTEILQRERQMDPLDETRALADEIAQQMDALINQPTGSRKVTAVVAQIIPTLPNQTDRIELETLNCALQRFESTARQHIERKGGHVVSNLSDRIVAVFERDDVETVEATFQQFVTGRVGDDQDCIISARAGISAGQVLLRTDPGQVQLSGAALLLSGQAAANADCGCVLVHQ